ncbi:unnamed protein product [Rhodiola kirilowii]
MAASIVQLLQVPHGGATQSQSLTTKLRPQLRQSVKLNGIPRGCVISCSASNGKDPDSLNGNGGKSAAEEKRRAELSAKIASGAFTVENSGWNAGRELFPKIPEAKGAISAIRSEAFFIPLYELFITYGGIFRLTFGPKSFLIVSDPSIAKHILRDNAKAYSKGILAEILDFVMGKGLIPADGEIWRVRRRAIVPALHMKYVTAMINLFGQATDRLCKKLDSAASDGEDVEMESLFSRLTLDIIGKAVFNYDFDSLTNDAGIVEAVYTVLREAEDRSTAPIPVWEIPIWKDISPRQKKVNVALKLINNTLDELIAICKRMVDEEELQFHEEYMNERDPSILHFLLASGDDVSSKQLRDDLMTMLIAGHETSAAVLTWTFYLLSQNPDAMAKLQNEVDSILGDRFPTIEDMKRLKYTTRVINEVRSLRLYPQPPVLIRRSIEDDMLGKYPIKRVLFLSSYLPFGGGPRKCVGDMFATFENITAVAMLVRRFNFQLALGAPPVGLTTGATIHTTQGLNMTVTKRVRPPIVPTLDTSKENFDSRAAAEPLPGQAEQVSLFVRHEFVYLLVFPGCQSSIAYTGSTLQSCVAASYQMALQEIKFASTQYMFINWHS